MSNVRLTDLRSALTQEIGRFFYIKKAAINSSKKNRLPLYSDRSDLIRAARCYTAAVQVTKQYAVRLYTRSASGLA